jgi:phosphoglycerate dehydrogenase-like enzyme
MRIVFHGENAASFSSGFAGLVGSAAEILLLPDVLSTEAERTCYASADVLIGIRYDATLPRFQHLSLFHVPGAGYDKVDLAALPPDTVVCNCFGHGPAIAEYVMTALLSRHVPLVDADARLRRGEWAYWAGAPDRTHQEIAGKTMGLVGFGHIGKSIAARAKAFDIRVHAANRSPVNDPALVDRWFALDDLDEFWRTADFIVVSVPLTPQTAGLVDRKAFAAMRPGAVVVNVGRGATIDEHALFDVLASQRIAGAIIDTWYQYPTPGCAAVLPSTLPFHGLSNVLMTPHMSAWTDGTIRRRQRAMADNIRRRITGQPCSEVIREAAA